MTQNPHISPSVARESVPPFTPTAEAAPLYEQIAGRLAGMIESGAFLPGDRVPSVRSLSREWRVSITTVMEAYRRLENRGLIEARPQSGFYVLPRMDRRLAPPSLTAPDSAPSTVTSCELVRRLIQDGTNPKLLQLGAAIPHASMLPLEKLHRSMSAIARRHPVRAAAYEFARGVKELRAEVARRAVLAGCALAPDQIVVTNGCTEALSLALRALCRPGDTVAIESPTYFGFLQMLETLGLRALEIPTCPLEGISVNALRVALDLHPVRCVLVSANFSNPLGSRMTEPDKRALVSLLAARGIPLIEDDMYGDMGFDDLRPAALKSFDREGLVLWCGSVSKSLAPGYRVGWVAPGRFMDEIERLKLISNIGTATLPQLAVAEFLANGGFDHHLRKTRRAYERQVDWLLEAVGRHFPDGTRAARPAGGFVVWVEMPERVDSRQLYNEAVRAGMTIAPGTIFSAKGGYQNFMRLNAAQATPEAEGKIAKLGALVERISGS